MFTQKISMDCTKEQYEKYLKDELLKMGYKEDISERLSNKFVYNNFTGKIGIIGMGSFMGLMGHNRTYFGSFNPELFLALAAMTDKIEGNYGEYVIGLKTGRFYRMSEDDIILPGYKHIRKATKEEIMAKFGEKKCTNNTLENKIDQLNEKGKVEINIPFNKPEIETGVGVLIEELMNTIEKAHIDALKSRGYKILKPKTWEEI